MPFTTLEFRTAHIFTQLNKSAVVKLFFVHLICMPQKCYGKHLYIKSKKNSNLTIGRK